jgi:ADP-ribose pyrophosphatase YjhB (NUDIX family)
MDFNLVNENTCLGKGFSFVLEEDSFVLDSLQEEKMNFIWEYRPDHIQEGMLLKVNSCEEKLVKVSFIPYSLYYASTKDPESFGNIYTLGVSAIAKWRGEFLIGKRSNKTFKHEGLFEWVPAGGIDDRNGQIEGVAIKEQVYRELEEETGIQRLQVNSLEIDNVFIFPEEKLFEVCCVIELDYGVEILKVSHEHQELFFLNESKVEELFVHTPELCVPGMKEMWDKFKLKES